MTDFTTWSVQELDWFIGGRYVEITRLRREMETAQRELDVAVKALRAKLVSPVEE